jgi:hypothetical protein
VPGGPGLTPALLPVDPGATFCGALIAAGGAFVTVTVFDALLLQPAPLVTLTLKVVVAATVTLIVCVVAPVDQRYDAKPEPASSVTLPFGQTLEGPLMATAGCGAIGIVVPELLLHPPTLTVTPRTTLPDAPATKLRTFVPWPPTIVPPVIVQLYAAPACDGTLAAALLFAQALAGAEIVADGGGTIGIVAVALPLQPAAVTVIPRTTLPDAAAVKLMFGVPWPAVMEPPLMVQA